MTIPDYETLMRPLLEMAASRGEVPVRDAIEKLSDQFRLTPDERLAQFPSGRHRIIRSRVHWAKTYLSKAGLLEPTKRGSFRITDIGRELLRTQTGPIRSKDLRRYPEFVAFVGDRGSTGDDGGDVIAGGGTTNLSAAPRQTPDEVMRVAFARTNEALRYELLTRVAKAEPVFFERLVVRLLTAMGFGGANSAPGRAIGRSGDGGIDGVIDQDALGLDRVYIQAKRYSAENPVGANAIRDFFGSLDIAKAAKSVFITTSGFTKQARETADRLGKRIVLIDGDQLAALMIRYDVGVRIEESFHVKKIDEDFFLDE